MFQRTRRAALVAAALCLAAPLTARAATLGSNTLSCSQVQFYANGVAWADLHYIVNNGGQLNVRMVQSGTNATYTVSGLASGYTIRYFFTYVNSGQSGAIDSPWATMTVSCGGGGTSYTLSVTRAGAGTGTVTSNPGGINCGSTCSASYASGTAVTLSAAPASGSTFGGWSGACVGTGTCVTTMTAARSVTATFNGSGGGGTGDACTACMYHRLVWSDEFGGSGQPSSGNWNYTVGNGYNAGAFAGWGNGEWEWYRPSECYQSGGNLVLRAQWLTSPLSVGGRSWYQTSCKITTQGKRSWNNARVEARIAMPNAAGTWPAFWMMGNSYDGSYTSSYAPASGYYDTMATNWASCGEIDIMEHKNSDTTVVNNLFWDTRTGVLPWSGSNVANAPSTVAAGNVSQFHTYALEWNGSNMYWYVDNVRVKTQSVSASTQEEFRQSFFVILNLALGGAFPGQNPVQGNFPLYMYVDYVRVYQQ
jgi:beta-glucanase (GH16 family)